MNRELLEKVRSKEMLVILTDSAGKILCQSKESPAGKLYEAYFRHELPETEDMVLYANQAGIAMGLLTGRLPIRECHAVRMSEGGLKVFRENHVETEYETLIPLVRSSKNESIVCPIEQFLFDHEERSEQWDFLTEQYKKTK